MYRISIDGEYEITIIQANNYDLLHYDDSQFVIEDSHKKQFKDIESAKLWLNAHYKSKYIVEEYQIKLETALKLKW